jgi:predicted RNase H-like HicB family nuclease
MNIQAEFRQEEDGRWIAEIPKLADARAYGSTRKEAAIALAIRALHILAERVASGELKVEEEPGAIILGGTAASFSEFFAEQGDQTASGEPVVATKKEDEERVASFPSAEELPGGMTGAEDIDRFVAAPLPTPRTLADYHRLRDMLEELIEKVGADESHPLAGFMERVGTLVEQFESTHLSEIIESKQKR